VTAPKSGDLVGPIAEPGSRIRASGRSIHDEAVLPVFRRLILSQPSSLSRNSPLESGSHISVRPPLVGFALDLDESISKVAL